MATKMFDPSDPTLRINQIRYPAEGETAADDPKKLLHYPEDWDATRIERYESHARHSDANACYLAYPPDSERIAMLEAWASSHDAELARLTA